jgi:hypothetical protein
MIYRVAFGGTMLIVAAIAVLIVTIDG